MDLVVLRLEPTAQSLVGWSSAPALLHGGSAPSLRFQPLRVEDLSVVVSCLNCVCACVHRDVDRGLAEDGNTSALPLPSEGGGVESALPQPSPIVTKATLSPKPTSQNFHSYRPRSNNWSEKGKNRTRSRSPFSPHSESGEDVRERDPVTTHGRRCPGIGPTGHDPSLRTARGLVDTPATRLPARPLPTHGHRDTNRNLGTSPGPVGSSRYTTEAPRDPTGSTALLRPPAVPICRYLPASAPGWAPRPLAVMGSLTSPRGPLMAVRASLPS